MNNLNKTNDSVECSNEMRERKMQQFVEAAIGDHAKQQILQILEKISLLKPPERLLLYLRMPGGTPESDPLRQPQNPLGTRSEINHTINWVRSHLENDPNVSIPKQDVYDDYVSYCAKVEIKPLSTADFGKVMKQVFPGIRPRRLGTRGHSRYCYAAMRKATKLEPPILPDLNPTCSQSPLSTDDDDSWKIIKSWAEGLLNSSFSSLKELATHITKHLNSSTSTAVTNSRQLLQKKILQRDLKERNNKNKDDKETNIQKKRKKKKQRQNFNNDNDEDDEHQQERQHQNRLNETENNMQNQRDDYNNSNKILHFIKTEIEIDDSLPMNLTNDHDSNINNDQINQGTNLVCDNNDDDNNNNNDGDDTTNTKIKTKNVDKINQNIKIEDLIKEPSPIVFCKKVRQAQQSKGLWGGTIKASTTTTTSVKSTITPQIASTSAIQQHQQFINDRSMKPPPSTIMNFQTSQLLNNNENNIPQINLRRLQMVRERDTSNIFNVPYRKKSKFIQDNQQENSVLNLQTNNNNNDGLEKIELATNDFIIPRERVISICNLDKDALDDYLNGGDNSQEQEAELLQYFQTENDPDDLGTAQTSVPLLENYQLFSDCKTDKCNTDIEKISQLRSYLQQNLQNTHNKNDNKILNQDQQHQQHHNLQQQQFAMFSGSASASLAMLSQRHHLTTETTTPGTPTTTSGGTFNEVTRQNSLINNFNTNNNNKGPKRKLNLNMSVPSSPNARRRNLNFVPISSPCPQLSNNNNNLSMINNNNNNNTQKMYNMSPFVSPTATPFVAKQKPITLNRSIGFHKLPNLQMPNDNIQSFTKIRNIKNEISASAPPSPSMIHNMRYGNNSGYQFSSNNNNNNNNNQTQSQCSPDLYQIESRSQSVPLHCRSPIYNNFDYGFSSTSNSVVQTPVPNEFTDFNNTDIIDMFNNDVQTQVKIEDNDFIPSLLDSDTSVASNTSVGMTEILPEFNPQNNFNPIMSRSVPSTPLPLPLSGGGGCNSSNGSYPNSCKTTKFFDNSKSVPTTPISSGTPFRYSPETNRDFLINGNTMERGKVASFYQHHQQQQPPQEQTRSVIAKSLSLDDGIDELTNFDEVTDPIIGSDLLNTL